MTAIREAFGKAGGPSPLLAEFQVALSQIVESYRKRGLPGASIASALEGAAQSFRRVPDVGQIRDAQQGQSRCADALSPNDGQICDAGDGQFRGATLGEPEFAGGTGHPDFADKAIQAMPPSGEAFHIGFAGPSAWTPQGERNSLGAGHQANAEYGHRLAATPREPTPAEAGRVLRALQPPRGPGAGALRPGALAARQAVRGESWLLSYQIPNGRDALSMRIGELLPTANRMLRDGAGQMHAAVVLRRLHDEAQKLGQVSPDQVVGKTLPPAVIDRLSDELTPERVIVEAAKWGKKFVDERAQLAGGTR